MGDSRVNLSSEKREGEKVIDHALGENSTLMGVFFCFQKVFVCLFCQNTHTLSLLLLTIHLFNTSFSTMDYDNVLLNQPVVFDNVCAPFYYFCIFNSTPPGATR